MRYLTRAGGRTFEITIEEEGRITVGDQSFYVDLQTIDDEALVSLLIDHESYELIVDEGEDGFRVLLRGELYEVTVEGAPPHRLRRGRPRPETLTPGEPPAAQEECVVRAPMPGLVVQVPVSVGQKVSAGEVLVVLESMKMENELLAPRQGLVKAVHVAAGDTPNLDEPLVTLS